MNVKAFSLVRRMILVAGLACGSAAVAGRGDEPAPAANAVPGGHVERLIEGLPSPWITMWDASPLTELRMRLLAQREAARRRGQQGQPQPNQWRPSYGDVAPLAVGPQTSGGVRAGHLETYRPEIERLETLMSVNRASTADYVLHGLIHYECGRYAVALRDFDQAMRSTSNPGEQLYSLRGLANFHLGNVRAACTDLGAATKLSPNLRNLNNRGVLACMLGQPGCGLEDFNAALAIKQWIVKPSTVFINRALALSELGQNEKAAAELKKVIETSGDTDAVGPGNMAAGLVYRRLGDFRRSGISYDIVIQLQRADDVVNGGQPNANAVQQMPEDHSFLDEFAGAETAVEALIGRGIAHQELDQHLPAIADYTKAIRLAPKRLDACVNRAVAYVAAGHLDLASRDLEAALRLDPNEPFALGNRGLLRISRGQTALGQADLARCLELRKDLRPVVERILPSAQPSVPQQPAGEPKQPAPSAPPAPPHLRPSPWGGPEVPHLSPLPSATPAAPAGQPAYGAASPAQAVAWLAAAGQSEDADATVAALAWPLRQWFRDLRAAAGSLDAATRKYMAAKNARSGDFFNLADSPLARQIEQEKQRHAASQKFVVRQMEIRGQEPVGNQGKAFRLVVRVTRANARGETQTANEVFCAVREADAWRLLPESAWLALSDAEKAKDMAAYFQKQIARLEAMRAILDRAAQAMAEGKPVSEMELLAAWSRVSADVPWPGKTGAEQPTLAEAIVKAMNSMIWEQGAMPLPGAGLPGQPGMPAYPGTHEDPGPEPGPASPHPTAKPGAKKPQPSPWQ